MRARSSVLAATIGALGLTLPLLPAAPVSARADDTTRVDGGRLAASGLAGLAVGCFNPDLGLDLPRPVIRKDPNAPL